MNWNNKKICILGFGRSGAAAAKRLAESGALVKVSETVNREKTNQDYIRDLQGLDINIEFGGHTNNFCLDSEMIVVSPGIHLDIPVLEDAKKLDIPIISEVELAAMFFTKPIIAITGTNGKTTTTALIGEIFKNAGFRVAVGGNIGNPLISIDDSALDYIIAEISSYQLETIDTFKPHIALILNLTPDHLERYKTMEAYAAAKERIFKNQRSDDFIVFNDDDPIVKKMAANAQSKKIPFSRKKSVEGGIFLNNGYIVRLKEHVIEAIIAVNDIKIKGDHNVENCLSAAAASALCGISASDINKTLREFAGVEHRIEFVETIGGVDFINDSKGTNVDSTVVALKAVANDKNVILILGGRDKGSDLSPLCESIKTAVKAVVLIGEASGRFENAIRQSGFDNIHFASSMDEAVKKSASLSGNGDIVLLSPACASFDMFSDFEHRGRVFKEVVLGMKNG